MEGSRPTWWKILNQTFVPLPCVLQLIWKGTLHPPTLLAFTTQFSCRIPIRIQEIHPALHLDVKYLGPQSQFQFVPSKGSLPHLTHNQRRDKNCPTLRTPQCQWQRTLSLLVRFQLPQKLLSMPSILMTLMAMAHQQRLPSTILKPILLIVMSLHLTLPFLLVTLQLRWLPIPKHQHLHHRESFSQLQWIHLVLHHSVHGPTQMIKSWWVWNRTQSPVLLGRRSVQDFIAIPRYANWDGASWNKHLGLLTNTVVPTHPSNQRRTTNKQYCTVNARRREPACGVTKQFSSRLDIFLLSCGFFFLSLFLIFVFLSFLS